MRVKYGKEFRFRHSAKFRFFIIYYNRVCVSVKQQIAISETPIAWKAEWRPLWPLVFRSFPQGKWSCVDLFELSLANMTRATYQNNRKLCSGVLCRKQTLQFVPETIPSCDMSTELLLSGDSSYLCIESCGIRPIYLLRPLSSDKRDADYSKLLNYDVSDHVYSRWSDI